MDQKSKSNSAMLITLVCVIAIAGVGYFVINPGITGLKDASIKLDAKTKEAADLSDKITTLNSLQSQFTQATDTVKKLGLAIPSTDQMPEIMVQIETMASESGLRVNSIQPAKVTAAGEQTAQSSVPVTVSLQGDYPGLYAFLTKMEKDIRPMNIKSINIASATKEESSVVNFTLNLEILKAP